MMKRIKTLEWLLLALVVVLVKFFLLPDSPAFVAGSIITVGACGLAALAALNRSTSTTE